MRQPRGDGEDEIREAFNVSVLLFDFPSDLVDQQTIWNIASLVYGRWECCRQTEGGRGFGTVQRRYKGGRADNSLAITRLDRRRRSLKKLLKTLEGPKNQNTGLMRLEDWETPAAGTA